MSTKLGYFTNRISRFEIVGYELLQVPHLKSKPYIFIRHKFVYFRKVGLKKHEQRF